MRLAIAVFLALMAGLAQAHTRSYSYSLWELDQTPYDLTVRINQYDLTRLQLHPDYTPNYGARVIELVKQNLTATADNSLCELQSPEFSLAGDGWVVVNAVVQCADSSALLVRSSLLLDVVSAHMHFLAMKDADGNVTEKVLTEADGQWQVANLDGEATVQGDSGVGSYWLLGVEHILFGWDHLAFVLGLVLLANSLGHLAWLITGFTLAHSVTLALATLGQVQPMMSAVEAIIGLSILLVAAEYAWEKQGKKILIPLGLCIGLLTLALLKPSGLPVMTLLGMTLFVGSYFAILKVAGRPQRWRLLIAFAFGLFHGFGFAGILADMSLPDDRVVAALFGFNLGVETGQLLFIALLWPLLRIASKRFMFEQLSTAALAGLGTFWFVTRAFT